MQEIRVITFCDYPGCADASREENPNGQSVQIVDFLVNTNQRGRKSRPIQIELCENHTAELKIFFTKMQKLTKGATREVLAEEDD